jgi:hypothetical protein
MLFRKTAIRAEPLALQKRLKVIRGQRRLLTRATAGDRLSEGQDEKPG